MDSKKRLAVFIFLLVGVSSFLFMMGSVSCLSCTDESDCYAHFKQENLKCISGECYSTYLGSCGENLPCYNSYCHSDGICGCPLGTTFCEDSFGSNYECDYLTHRCVLVQGGCIFSSDCYFGKVCSGGFCSDCSTSTQCTSDDRYGTLYKCEGGSCVSIFAGGKGTESNPYLISTCQQLQSINRAPNSYYKLKNDIDCSATKTWDSGKGFSPLGNSTNSFNGHFNGAGYSISGLYILNRDIDYVGLFGYVGGSGFIENVSLSIDTIKGKDYVGGLAGYNDGTISKTKVEVNLIEGNENVGGFVGYNNGEIQYSYFDGVFGGRIKGINSIGGFVGRNNKIITDSYSVWPSLEVFNKTEGDPSNFGGFVGRNNHQAYIFHCFVSRVNPEGIQYYRSTEYGRVLTYYADNVGLFAGFVPIWPFPPGLIDSYALDIYGYRITNFIGNRFTDFGSEFRVDSEDYFYSEDNEPLKSWDSPLWNFYPTLGEYPRLKIFSEGLCENKNYHCDSNQYCGSDNYCHDYCSNENECGPGEICHPTPDGGVCLECLENSNCLEGEICYDNTCVECTSPSHCIEKNCKILEDNCLDASCGEGYVCQDNQNFLVDVNDLCNSFDETGCDFYEPYCIFLESKGDCVATIPDQTLYEIYHNYRTLWNPLKSTVYKPICIEVDDCPDYWNCVSGTCKSDECKWQCDYDTQYCNLSTETCFNKRGYFGDCTEDYQCFSGYCSPFGYCTEDCIPPGNCPENSIGCFPIVYEKDEYLLCVECQNENDCPSSVPCIDGRCQYLEDTGDLKVTISEVPEYLGQGIIKLIYLVASESTSVDNVFSIEGSGLKIINLSIQSDSVKLNLSSNIVGTTNIEGITIAGEGPISTYGVSSAYTTSSKLEEKSDTFQNFFFNLSNALEFKYDDGTYQNANVSIVYTCEKGGDNYILSYSKVDYYCLEGKGYFCESEKPCAYILEPNEKEVYVPNTNIRYTASTFLNSGNSYNWYIFDKWIKNGYSFQDDLPPYPYIYDLTLKVNDSIGKEDFHKIDLNVVDETPACIRTDNTAIWSYFKDENNKETWVKEIVSSLVESDNSYSPKIIKGGDGIVQCNYSAYGGTSNCCPKGEVCIWDNDDKYYKCVQSDRGYCSLYLDQYNCTNDPEGYALYNTALPEGASCFQPFYNSTSGKWYNTYCSCIWEENQCKSSYNLLRDNQDVGTCSVYDKHIAGNCSAGDEFEVFKRIANWTTSSGEPKPSECEDKDNMRKVCEGDFYKLNFFTWFNFLLVIIAIIIIYYFLSKAKKERVKIEEFLKIKKKSPKKINKPSNRGKSLRNVSKRQPKKS